MNKEKHLILIDHQKKRTAGKFFTKRSVITAALLLSMQVVIYAGVKPIVEQLPKVDLSLPIDAMIPYVPFFFLPYLICFAYWALMYTYIIGLNIRRTANLIVTVLCSSVVIGLLFIFIPTEMSRPEDLGAGFFGWLAKIAYAADSPVNLFPSFHCFTSWMCFVGIRGVKEVKLWLKITSFIMALLTFASTMFVKQHYFVDFIPSVIIAEFFWYLSHKIKMYLPFKRFFSRHKLEET